MSTKHRAMALAACLALALPLAAEEIRVLAPYLGFLSDTREASGQDDLEDSGLLTGLYFQWIDTESYQWNAFLYGSPDVNYSRILGGHLIFDKYFGPDWHGKFVIGAGLEALRVDLDAGSELGTDDFELATTVLVPYLRAGKYLKASLGPAELSFLPWVGLEPQWVWGDLDVTVTIPMPPPPHQSTISESLDDDALYGIAGLNAKVTLFHFLDLEAKYQGTFDGADYFSTFNGVAFAYLSRCWGLSYRFKYLESSQGSESYHLFGAAYIF
ncbi:MAG TPA: hypothetical protein PLB91_14315 [Spirochaetales bacterium]|nr:hypothetical protein [Spirochaetales bacterium]HRY54701.1 hypothetical protein [Spirochaetia bacterium]HRZ66136.1 hypothetical protein [Spirochaetia bacterium]